MPPGMAGLGREADVSESAVRRQVWVKSGHIANRGNDVKLMPQSEIAAVSGLTERGHKGETPVKNKEITSYKRFPMVAYFRLVCAVHGLAGLGGEPTIHTG